MLGVNDNYSERVFTEIIPLKFDELKETIRKQISNVSDTSLLDVMLPYILNKLKKGTDLTEICELEIFWEESSLVYGMDYRTIFTCMIERYKYHQIDLLSLFLKLGIALPFVYQWIVEEKLIFKVPLRAYSHCLAIDCPIVISLGPDSIGKSTLLNKIYSAKFITNKAGVLSDGIDVLFSTPEFLCGFTIFDIHGHACKQKHLLEVFFKMMPLENCWILLQIRSVDETDMALKMLKSFGIDDVQIICIVRDFKGANNQEIEKLMNNRQNQVLYIRKIEEGNPAFNANLAVQREKLFMATGIGESSKKPDGVELQNEDHNVYMGIENRVRSKQFQDICIDITDDATRNFSLFIDEQLKRISVNMPNLQTYLFKHIDFNMKIQHEENKKIQLAGKDTEGRQETLTTTDQTIVSLSKTKASTTPSDLVREYNKKFIQQYFHLINEMNKRVSVWQTPILSPLLKERNGIVNDLEKCTSAIRELEKKKHDSQQGTEDLTQTAEIERLLKEKENLEERKKENSKLIDNKTINRDFFMRELLAIYGDEEFLRRSHSDNSSSQAKEFDKDLYINAFIEYMIKGNEIEIIDGDNNTFNSGIVSEIIRGLQTKYGEIGEEAPFVVSVIGPQSTGKSTLLNMLFGCNFQMSAGRCTKGLYASVFKTKYVRARTLLVLDTEGLLSIEKANEEYDKKLTLFSMACSQIMLVNLNGEINAAMKKILTISLFVANQLKVLKTRPVIIFILRNMMDLNVDKQREMIANVKKALKEVIELSKLELSQVLDFKEEKAFFLMLSAFNKDSVYNKGKELFQTSSTNAKFAALVQDLREKTFAEADSFDKKFQSLSDWVKQATEVWTTIDLFNDMLMIDSIKEINERKELGDIITKIMENLIEPHPSKTSFRSKLEEILETQEELMNASGDLVDATIYQQFDVEEESFKEKVKTRFDNEVKSKTYEEKLKKEYKDRLYYAITASKTQAIQKYKAIAEKRKIKNVVQAVLTDLQNRSEIEILKWQRIQQNISDEEKRKQKAKIIEEFTKLMDNRKKETEFEMNKNKKTRIQWEAFVNQHIKSARGTLPVEKHFFSISALGEESAGGDSHNVIRLIERATSAGSPDVLLKIPSLIQRKLNYSKSNKATPSAGRVNSTVGKIYVEHSRNSVWRQRWNEWTQWIPEIFRRSRSTESNHDTTTSSFASEGKIHNALAFCEDKEVAILIYSMFLEMYDYLETSIEKEVNDSAEYQITCLKQNLLQIYAKMNELNQRFLNDEDLEFTIHFGAEIIEWLFVIIVNKMFTDEENTYKKLQEDFEKSLAKLLEEFKKRLDATFGDVENAKDMASKMFNNIKNISSFAMGTEYKHELKQATFLNANKLVELSDQVFYQTNGHFDANGIYEYITQMIDYMKKVYSKHFESKAIEVQTKRAENYVSECSQQYENLIKKLETLEKIFTNYNTWDASDNELHRTTFTAFFKAFLEGGQNVSPYITTYLTPLGLGYLHSGIELRHSEKLFDHISVAIYQITNPKVFLTTFKDQITSLRDRNRENWTTFILSDDIKREKDRIKIENQVKALGCIEQCPYCGCKCTEITERHDAHRSNKHRLMAFKGSFELLSNGKKGFVFDLCNSENTIRHSKWKENSSSQLSISESTLVRERMNQYSVGEGDVTITLAWFDSNDLDLHVTCPCGTNIYFGNKHCPTCSGFLDLDMNVCCCGGTCLNRRCSSSIPSESCYFIPAKNGTYKVSVNYFSGPKGTAGKSSRYEVRIQTHSNNHIQRFTGSVEADTERRHVQIGSYEHSGKSLNFIEHVKKNFPTWGNIEAVADAKWEIVLKKAWWQVASRMSQFYGYENNTPAAFQNVTY